MFVIGSLLGSITGNLIAGAFSSTPNQAQTNKQEITNNIVSTNNSLCISWARASVSNNPVIINGSEVGDITIEATGTADMTCLINQQINSILSTALSSESQQTNNQNKGLFSIFGGGNSGQSAINIQSMYNNITNTSRSVCGATSQSQVDNNPVVFNESTGGDILISADASAKSSCTMTNLIAIEAYNDLANKGNQGNVERSVFVSALVALIVIVIVIAIVIAIIVGTKSVASIASSKKQQPTDPLAQELAMLSHG